MTGATAALPAPFKRSVLGRIGLSSAIAAILATGLHVAAGRTLGPQGYAHFVVVWGLFFTFTGILSGLQQEVTRTVAMARRSTLVGHRPVIGTLVIGIVGSLVILATAPIWIHRLLDQQALPVAATASLGFLAYAWANQVNGALAATHRWHLYAWAVVLDGAFRFLFVGGVLLLHTDSVGWALALVAPTLAWALLAISPEVRSATMAAGDASTFVFIKRSLHSIVSAACSALLVAGFPILVQLFAGGVRTAAAGTALATLMASRAPLLFLLGSYQGVWITQIVSSPTPMRLLARWSGIGAILTIPVLGFAYLFGPRLLRVVFGGHYVTTGGFFVALVVSGLVLGVITLTGWTTLALGHHTLFVAGWIIAVVVTSTLLSVPLSTDGRITLGLIGGPLVGAMFHVVAVWCTSLAMAEKRVRS